MNLADLGKQIGYLQTALNIVWTLVTGFLVMFMQAGFALVETGLTREKNVAHTMGMNFFVYSIGIVGYWLCGFALQMGGVGALEAIEVDVDQRKAPTAVFVHERERRARHFLGIQAQPLGQAAHECGLARTQIARQQDDGPGLQIARERGGNGAGLVLGRGAPGGGHDSFAGWTTRRRAVSSRIASPM